LVTLFWAFFLLFLFMYVIGVMMINGVATYINNAAGMASSAAEAEAAIQDLDALKSFYGSFGNVILTLFRAVSGGDWAIFAEPLQQTGWFYGALWIPYMGFVLYGLLNIVTGIFVDCTMKTAQSDHAIAAIEQLQKEEQLTELLSKVFGHLDHDGTGRLTEMEFDLLVTDAEVLAYLASIGIDRPSARRLFKTLDHDGTGMLTLDQIVTGCFTIKGDAKAVDMLAVLQHMRKVDRMLAGMQDQKLVDRASSVQSQRSQRSRRTWSASP